MKQGHDVICLGLGSPESSENARVQLAFLLGICDVFEIVRGIASHKLSETNPTRAEILQNIGL